MITPADITALIELLRRTPMSGPESLYASSLLERLAQVATPEQPAEAKPKRARKAKAPAPAAPPAEPTTSEPLRPEPLRPDPLAGY